MHSFINIHSLEKALSLLIAGGCIQGFVLTFLLFHKKRYYDRYLGILIVFFSINIAVSEFIVTVIGATPMEYLFFQGPFQLILGPILYFYIRSMIGQNSNFALRSIIHFIPISLYIIVSIVYHIVPNSLIGHYITAQMTAITLFILSVIFIQLWFYIQRIEAKLRTYWNTLKDCRSNLKGYELKWPGQLIKVFVVLNLSNFIILFWYIGDHHRIGIQKTVALLYCFCIYYLGYRGLLQKHSINVNSNKGESDKYGRSSLNKERIEYYWSKLEVYMEKEKPYLTPALKLTDLSEKLGLSSNHLSQVFTRKHRSFYEYINNYRIDTCKTLLRDPSKKHLSILQIAFEGGFNSKTTFNTLFKNTTGMTPSQYRRN